MSDLSKDFDDAYQTATRKWEPYWKKAKRTLKMYMGDQLSASDKAYLEEEGRDIEVFNRMKRIGHLISGYQRKNRLAIRVEATQGSDKTASQLSNAIQWLMVKMSAYHILSDAFEFGALVAGINYVESWLDYSQDFVNGDIRLSRVFHNSILLDPDFTQKDLSDCKYVLRRKWVSPEEAQFLLPHHARAIRKMTPKGYDNRFPDQMKEKSYKNKPLFRLDQFYREESTRVHQLMARQTGQLVPIKGNSKEIDEYLASPFMVQGQPTGYQNADFLKKFTTYKKIIRVGYLIDDVEFYDGPDPGGLEDQYPFVPIFGDFAPEHTDFNYRLQGALFAILDAQKQSNRRRLKMEDMLDTQMIGLAVEANAMVDDENALMRGHGINFWMKEGKLDRIKPMAGPPIQPGTLESMKSFDSDMDELLGISGEISGMIEAGQAAENFILAKLREGNALSSFQSYFDPYRASKKLLGDKLLKMIQMHYPPDKIQRIIKEQPTPEFYNKDFGVYDCVVTEGCLTDSQKKMRYGEAMALKQQGVPIPYSKILEYSGLEIEPEIIQAIRKQEQMQQQMQQAEMMLKVQALKVELSLNQARANQANGIGEFNRARAFQAEAGFQHNQLMDMAQLNLDIDRLEMQHESHELKAMQIKKQLTAGADPQAGMTTR